MVGVGLPAGVRISFGTTGDVVIGAGERCGDGSLDGGRVCTSRLECAEIVFAVRGGEGKNMGC